MQILFNSIKSYGKCPCEDSSIDRHIVLYIKKTGVRISDFSFIQLNGEVLVIRYRPNLPSKVTINYDLQ
jgi:hypothetical protein